MSLKKGYKKRRLSHDNQSFINLKSNTMKNTGTKVRVFCNSARESDIFVEKSGVLLTYINF